MYASKPNTSSLSPNTPPVELPIRGKRTPRMRMNKCTNSKPLNPDTHPPHAQHHDQNQTLDLDSCSEADLNELKRKSLADVARIRSFVKQIESREEELAERKKRTAPATPERQNHHNKRQCIRETVVEYNSPGCRRVQAAMMRNCGVILERLMKHRHGWVFNKPVDAVALRLPDYHEVVKRPMDLGTVKSKLDKRVYATPLMFASDVRLTFSNAMLYNPKEEEVYSMAADLRNVFDKLFDLAYEKYRAERRAVIVEEQRKMGRPDKTVDGMNCGGVGEKLVFKEKVRVDSGTRKEMEIEKLGLLLQGLAEECLDEILQIVAKRNPELTTPDGDGEIELDVHALDSETIWDLHRFVMQNSKAGQNHKAV